MATNAADRKRLSPISIAERVGWAERGVLDAARLAVAFPDDKAYLAALGSRLRELDDLRSPPPR